MASDQQQQLSNGREAPSQIDQGQEAQQDEDEPFVRNMVKFQLADKLESAHSHIQELAGQIEAVLHEYNQIGNTYMETAAAMEEIHVQARNHVRGILNASEDGE